MALVYLDPTALVAEGSFSISKVTRLTVFKVGTISSGATLSVRGVRGVYGQSVISSSASLQIIGAFIFKYGRTGNLNSVATMKSNAWKYKVVHAQLSSESKLEAYMYDRDIRESMSKYLPTYYEEFTDVKKMMDAEASEVVRMQSKLKELLDQFFVNSATYGLDLWEQEVGITTIPQRSSVSRRHFIIAKLRGEKTITRSRLNQIVDSFYTSEITENNPELTVKVKLIGKRGVPKNLEDIDVAITDVLPAHLSHEYEFTYLTWGEVEQAGLTWEQANNYTNEQIVKTFLIDPGYPYEN